MMWTHYKFYKPRPGVWWLVSCVWCQVSGDLTPRVLVQRGAALSQPSLQGFSPLHLAAYTGQWGRCGRDRWPGDVERARVLLESLDSGEIDRCTPSLHLLLGVLCVPGQALVRWPPCTWLWWEVTCQWCHCWLRQVEEAHHLPPAPGAFLCAGDLVVFSPLHYAAWFGREQIAQVPLASSPLISPPLHWPLLSTDPSSPLTPPLHWPLLPTKHWNEGYEGQFHIFH